MKKIFQQYIAIALSILYLMITMGLGVHECHCKQERQIVFGGALAGNGVCCCNKTDKTVMAEYCDNDLPQPSCCPEGSSCCPEKQQPAGDPECDTFSAGRCCSFTLLSFGSDYRHSEISLPTAPDNVESVAAIYFPQTEISAGIDADIFTVVKYPPPEKYGNTLPIYHFCQLRL